MARTQEEELQKLFNSACEKRVPHESEIQEAFELVKPIREWQPHNQTNAAPDRDTMVDATLARMTRNLVTNTIRLLIPPNGQWARITFVNDALEDQYGPRYANHRTDADDKLHRHFVESNFYLAVTEALYDEVIGGTMCLQFIDDVENPNPKRQKLNYIAVPTDELYFLEEFDQTVDVVFRKHSMSGRQIMQRWGHLNILGDLEKEIGQDPVKDFDICESVIPDGNGYIYRISKKDNFEKIVDDQRFTLNPFIVARWEKMLGHVWGNSPCRDSMLHQRVANAIRNDILRYGAYVAGGLWQTNDDAVNTHNIMGEMQPGALIAIEEEIRPIPFPGNFNLTFDMIGLEKEEMKHLMFDSTPPSEDALKYMNDVAVSFLRQEFLSQVGEPAQRLQRELLDPTAAQAAIRLQRRGEITTITPEEIEALRIPKPSGKSGEFMKNQSDLFKVDVTAAIQKAQAAQEAQEIAAAIANAGSIFGPQQISLHVDMDKATRKVLLGGGIPPDMLRKPSEVEEIKKNLEQVMAGAEAEAAAQSIAQGQEGFEPVRGVGPPSIPGQAAPQPR